MYFSLNILLNTVICQSKMGCEYCFMLILTLHVSCLVSVVFFFIDYIFVSLCAALFVKFWCLIKIGNHDYPPPVHCGIMCCFESCPYCQGCLYDVKGSSLATN